MAKDYDFGGLPESVFTGMLGDLTTLASLPMSAPEKLSVLAAMASEEHAAAIATSPAPNVAEYTMAVIKIRDKFDDIKSGAPGAVVPDLLALIHDLEVLWA